MADSDRLREQRAGTVINATSKKQEEDVIKALKLVEARLVKKFERKIVLTHSKEWRLRDIVGELRQYYPDVEFHHHFNTSAIRPDGGILFIRNNRESAFRCPILIPEVKNQGTNDRRAQEGKPRQARGTPLSAWVKTSSACGLPCYGKVSFPLSASDTDATLRILPRFWTGCPRWLCLAT